MSEGTVMNSLAFSSIGVFHNFLFRFLNSEDIYKFDLSIESIDLLDVNTSLFIVKKLNTISVMELSSSFDGNKAVVRFSFRLFFNGESKRINSLILASKANGLWSIEYIELYGFYREALVVADIVGSDVNQIKKIKKGKLKKYLS